MELMWKACDWEHTDLLVGDCCLIVPGEELDLVVLKRMTGSPWCPVDPANPSTDSQGPFSSSQTPPTASGEGGGLRCPRPSHVQERQGLAVRREGADPATTRTTGNKAGGVGFIRM